MLLSVVWDTGWSCRLEYPHTASRVVWASSQTWWTELQRGELREGDGAREGGVGGEIGGNHVTFMELKVTQCHFYNNLLVRAVTKSTWFPEEGTQTPHLDGECHICERAYQMGYMLVQPSLENTLYYKRVGAGTH